MRIYLIRHGRSQAQDDWSMNSREPDHAIGLTPEGEAQAQEAGPFLREELLSLPDDLRRGRILLWTSPYRRAMQTAAILEGACLVDGGRSLFLEKRQHVLLAEQQFGLFDGLSDEERAARFPTEFAHYERVRGNEGKLWPRLPLGESRFDVCARVHSAFREFDRAQQRGVHVHVVVAHGTVIRAFVQMWCGLPAEWMDREPNPANVSVRLIDHEVDRGYVFPGFSERTAEPTKEATE